MKLGIDASNIRDGGGITHLAELLNIAEPTKYGFTEVIVWGGSKVLDRIVERSWLIKCHLPILEKNILYRTFWQRFQLSAIARAEKCDILFIPGGAYGGNFKPIATISQNLLPFEWRELTRYGFSLKTIKMLLLRLIQSRTFKTADGMIFLTQYAKNTVNEIVNTTDSKTTIIPHGINSRFVASPRKQFPIEKYTKETPFRILYVSIIEVYKHQWNVAEAVASLSKAGLPVVLDLVGPAYPPALKILKRKMAEVDPSAKIISYIGAISHADLHKKYTESDLAVFASSCENLPIILLEGMASGLPVACSNLGPMPEILGQAGIYFNPLVPADISAAIKRLIHDPELRTKLSAMSFEKANQYSWTRCSADTFNFLSKVAVANKT